MRSTSFRDIFNSVDFVKPLYKKSKTNNKVRPNKKHVSVNIDSNYKLGGNELFVKREVGNDIHSDLNTKTLTTVKYIVKERNNSLSEGQQICDNVKVKNERKHDKKTSTLTINKGRQDNMLNIGTSKETHSKEEENFIKLDLKDNNNLPLHKAPENWLRVYPAPSYPNEPTFSIVFRCIVSQLGLIAVLIIWTVIWVFFIHYFEAPHEMKVSLDFEKKQNLLVIELATELRQITPLSPKWRQAIEERLQEERRLTMKAVGRGAMLHPGRFWSLPGTFLFTIYVMTALGFGAPVPHTVSGRNSALIYAVLAVPTHFYLMLNASTCVVVHIEHCIQRFRLHRAPSIMKRTALDMRESRDCSRNSDLMKLSTKKKLRKRMICVISIIFTGRCIPLITILYYIGGALSFGVARVKPPLETAMFPLEFTTTGGLENVEGYVRILYGFYVEGAMALLAYAVATARRHSSARVTAMAEKYKLFASEKCTNCSAAN